MPKAKETLLRSIFWRGSTYLPYDSHYDALAKVAPKEKMDEWRAKGLLGPEELEEEPPAPPPPPPLATGE